ncbi:maltose ABC transporter substrate-binding protein [Effusibacillus consociatus]|uniref:Maltodextrin-binding protein n=1 Tax=Effusibacillus consociatus TaxID=1117041 RepID=A0ABV9Q7T2_9BACL
MKRNSWKKALSLVATTGLLAGVLAGCASSSKPTDEKPANDPAKKSSKITVWSYWKEQEFELVKSAAQEWAKKTGNEVEIVIDNNNEFQKYAAAAQSGKGPDAVFGMPHDNLGTFAKAGLLAEMPKDLVNEKDYVDVAWKAVTVEGKKVAFPMSMETYALFYNKEKVPNPPKTWSEFLDIAQKQGFMYDINNAYFSYAFIAGNGGYVFKNNNGTYDTNDIGLANEGAIKGYQTIQDFVKKYKFMPADVVGDIAKGKFQSKNIGMFISGPWDVAPFKKANVPFAVAPFPTLENGQKPKTFVGLQTAFVSSKSQNQDKAWDLLKYLNENTSKKALELSARIPVKKSILDDPSFKENQVAAVIAEIASAGEPMPNIPQIQAFWTPMGNNLKLLTQGKSTPEKAAKDIVDQMKQGIATLK